MLTARQYANSLFLYFWLKAASDWNSSLDFSTWVKWNLQLWSLLNSRIITGITVSEGNSSLDIWTPVLKGVGLLGFKWLFFTREASMCFASWSGGGYFAVVIRDLWWRDRASLLCYCYCFILVYKIVVNKVPMRVWHCCRKTRTDSAEESALPPLICAMAGYCSVRAYRFLTLIML